MNLLILLSCLSVFTFASAVEYTLKENNKVCFRADASITLQVTYPTSSKQNKVEEISLDGAKVIGKCGEYITWQVSEADFVHSFTMKFGLKDGVVQNTQTTFNYSLADKSIFSDANFTDDGLRTATANPLVTLSEKNTYYQCSVFTEQLKNPSYEAEVVAVKAKDFKIQVYPDGTGSYSGSGEICDQDKSTTTVAGKTTTSATAKNTFFVKDKNGTYCLVLEASEFNVTSVCGAKNDNFFIDATKSTTTGSCESDKDILNIESNDKDHPYNIEMVFAMTSTNYYLQNVTVDLDACQAKSDISNTDLRAPTKNVYRCNAEQTIIVDKNVSLVLSGVRVQAFRSDNDTTLDDKEYICMEDSEVSQIVPIAVGCALAGLIVIVLIAYIIGRLRRRNYQPVE